MFLLNSKRIIDCSVLVWTVWKSAKRFQNVIHSKCLNHRLNTNRFRILFGTNVRNVIRNTPKLGKKLLYLIAWFVCEQKKKFQFDTKEVGARTPSFNGLFEQQPNAKWTSHLDAAVIHSFRKRGWKFNGKSNINNINNIFQR